MDRHSQTYSSAAVAADAEQSSNIGVNTLRRGGNAVDAAIAAMLSVGVVNLHSTGIGGGGFMVIYNSNSRRSYAIDFRDKAPLNSTTFMLDRYGMGYELHALNSVWLFKRYIHRIQSLSSLLGGLAIAVPGMLHGLYSVWKQFGRLPWKELFQPAINLARQGFAVTKDIERAIKMRSEFLLTGNYPGLL